MISASCSCHLGSRRRDLGRNIAPLTPRNIKGLDMINWAFVTGGAGDIGSAICQTLARDGFGIVCVDLDEERAETICYNIR
ncbi:SDR family NAD(P)-dependent oxidoreductase, partial [Pseudomonas sp. GP01-A4]